MKEELLEFIHRRTLEAMRFLMDNEYPIHYDSAIVCQDVDVFDECYCPIHNIEKV
tara:strand:- start:326 stop:490 length:165 start_codon:yes stop_codon:yes gene_type:complete